MSAKDYVTTAEAATILGVGTTWVGAMCRTGALSATGGGRGARWRIERASVEELAAQRAEAVDPTELEDVAREIEEDQEAQRLAKLAADDSFKDRVITIARRYGPGVLAAVVGVAVNCFAPGNPVSGALIAEGIRRIWGK
jgi:excisionase family DNA binding protein